MARLTATQLKTSLASVPGWRKKGAAITRIFQFNDFVAAMQFVDSVAKAAEKAWHHPDIDIRWNQVTLALTTHDQGGLTEKDVALAALINKALGQALG